MKYPGICPHCHANLGDGTGPVVEVLTSAPPKCGQCRLPLVWEDRRTSEEREWPCAELISLREAASRAPETPEAVVEALPLTPSPVGGAFLADETIAAALQREREIAAVRLADAMAHAHGENVVAQLKQAQEINTLRAERDHFRRMTEADEQTLKQIVAERDRLAAYVAKLREERDRPVIGWAAQLVEARAARDRFETELAEARRERDELKAEREKYEKDKEKS